MVGNKECEYPIENQKVYSVIKTNLWSAVDPAGRSVARGRKIMIRPSWCPGDMAGVGADALIVEQHPGGWRRFWRRWKRKRIRSGEAFSRATSGMTSTALKLSSKRMSMRCRNVRHSRTYSHLNTVMRTRRYFWRWPMACGSPCGACIWWYRPSCPSRGNHVGRDGGSLDDWRHRFWADLRRLREDAVKGDWFSSRGAPRYIDQMDVALVP